MEVARVVPTDRRPTWVKVATYNTHVGTVLASGGVRWLKRRYSPDLVLLQEVQSPLARARARLVFPILGWSIVGLSPASTGRSGSGTLVVARRSVLKRIGHRNHLVSRTFDRWHPERRNTGGAYLVRGTDVVLDVASVHPWALGPAPAPAVADGHRRQIRVAAVSARAARSLGHLPIRGGDLNEDLNGSGHSLAERQLSLEGLRPARPHDDHATRIDEIFVADELTVANYRVVPMTRFRGAEHHHPAIVVDVAIPTRKAHTS